MLDSSAPPSTHVKVDARPAIVVAMMMMVTPPVAMTPTPAMNFDYIGCFGVADGGALTGKRACSLRNSKEHHNGNTDCGESFIHR
jgi:hypothetical protein